MNEVANLGLPLVELTGGEPLAQTPAKDLVSKLCDGGYKVLIETGGSESIDGLDPRCHIIMDLKCPDSGMSDRNLLANLDLLKATDEIKFVIASRSDFDWANEVIRQHRLDERFQLLMSCAWGLVAPKDLVQWMLEAKVTARLNLQQHKYIWGPRVKGV
jgi:7-carboxy-7-deazaguanine synthase